MRRLDSIQGFCSDAQVPRITGLVFRRKGGHKFFEARVAAERIPVRIQAQLPIAQIDRSLECGFQLIDGAIVVSGPSIDESEVIHEERTVDWVLLNRKQLKRAASLAYGIGFMSQEGVDHSQHAPGRSPIWLLTDGTFQLRMSSGEGDTRAGRVAHKVRSKAFAP